MFYIYHVPGKKIGVTQDVQERMKRQRATTYEILEEHTDGWLAGDREIELQKEYGYPVDCVHYMKVAGHTPKTEEHKQALRDAQTGKILSNQTKQKLRDLHLGKPKTKEHTKKVRLANRKVSKEIAEEIRSKYVPVEYSARKLAKEYNLGKNTIWRIIKKLKIYSED